MLLHIIGDSNMVARDYLRERHEAQVIDVWETISSAYAFVIPRCANKHAIYSLFAGEVLKSGLFLITKRDAKYLLDDVTFLHLENNNSKLPSMCIHGQHVYINSANSLIVLFEYLDHLLFK